MAITWSSEWFYGNKISDYGLENGRVDYGTLAKAFQAVLNNNIFSYVGFENWSLVSGTVDNSDEIEEKQEELDEVQNEIDEYIAELEEQGIESDTHLEELGTRRDDLTEEIEELEREQEYPDEIFQYYIVDDNGAEILQEADEIVYYNEELDMYLWGVTHYGTGWDYVLTNIKIERED